MDPRCNSSVYRWLWLFMSTNMMGGLTCQYAALGISVQEANSGRSLSLCKLCLRPYTGLLAQGTSRQIWCVITRCQIVTVVLCWLTVVSSDWLPRKSLTLENIYFTLCYKCTFYCWFHCIVVGDNACIVQNGTCKCSVLISLHCSLTILHLIHYSL